MKYLIVLVIGYLICSNLMFGQVKKKFIIDSSNLANRLEINLTPSLFTGFYNKYANSLGKPLREVRLSLDFKVGYFLSKYTNVGLSYHTGSYHNNFNILEPNTIGKGIYIKHYFAHWKGYHLTTYYGKNNKVNFFHPSISFEMLFTNFIKQYNTSVNNTHLIFTPKSNNPKYIMRIGGTYRIKNKLNLALEVGAVFQEKNLPISAAYQSIKWYRISTLGFSYFIRKNKK
jgi:hypothetical protein